MPLEKQAYSPGLGITYEKASTKMSIRGCLRARHRPKHGKQLPLVRFPKLLFAPTIPRGDFDR
jgi:hypothetical protein